jgi:predicted Zn-dependent peptidase
MITRTSPPPTFSPEFKSFPEPEQQVLGNGIKLYSYNMGSQQVFQLELIFSIGAADCQVPSIASLTCNMLREGTKSRTAEQLNDLLDFYGSFLDIKSGLDYSTLTLYGRTEFLSQLLPIIAEILKEPLFTESAFEKHKKRAIQNLQISQKKTSYWSTRLLRKSIFGEAHTYAKLPSIDDLKAIQLSDLEEFHRRLLNNINSILISGSFDQVETVSLVEKYVGDIKVAEKVLEVVKPVYGIDNIEKKLAQSTQASIALGGPAINPTEADYPAHALIIKLLGGYFGSRLMKTLREEKGLTYGVHAYMLQLRQGNFMQITADVKLEAVNESVDIINQEIQHLLSRPVPDNELTTIKNYMLGEYVNDSNTAFDFASLYKKIIIQKLPSSFYNTFYTRIANLSVKDVERIKEQVIDPVSLSTVKVY